MERVYPLIGPVLLLAVKIHSNARQPRRRIKPIALVRPPSVDSKIRERLVKRPVAADLAIGRPMAIRSSARGQGRAAARIFHGARQALAFEHDMQSDLEVLLVELFHGLWRVRKGSRVPGELAVVGVPAVGAEPGAEVDQGIAGQLL